jgi:hypothetical protein
VSRSPSRARARIGCEHVVPERFDVLPELCETLATGAIVVACALALLGDEPRVAQDPQMLRDSGLSDVRLTGKFTDGVPTQTQLLVEPAPRRVGKSDEHLSIRHRLY